MFKHLIKGLVAGFAIKLLADYRQLSLQLLKIEATKCYLRGVQMARLSVLGLMQMALLIALIGLGVLFLHVGLFILLPWSVAAKALLLVILGLVYVITGGLALAAAMDEKTWMKKSGAAKMLEDVTSPSPKN